MGDYGQRLYHTLKSLRALQRAHPNPLVVYQMSKVGSTAVCKSLNEAGIIPLHVHYIHPEMWRRARQLYVDAGMSIPYHFHVGHLLRYYLRWTSRRIRVITLVRDPVARFLSGEFQNLRLGRIPKDDPDAAARQLEDRLATGRGTTFTFSWFERELEPVLGINPVDQPFDRESGHGLLNAERADVLVLKLEKLSDLLPSEVSNFVGAKLVPATANVRTESPAGAYYGAVLESLRLSRDLLTPIYQHPWVQHFYKPDETEAFLHRWTKGGS